MLDTYLTIVTHPLLWIAIGLTVTFYLITWVISLNQKSPNFSSKRWLRDHYVEVVFWLGLAAICAAFYFYLFDAGRAVAAMADELLFRARTLPETRDTGRGTEDVRGLAQGMALLLGAIVAAATIPFTMLRTWINERTATATEEGLVTDRINKAVEGLGAEKTVSTIGRPITVWTGRVQKKHFTPGAYANKDKILHGKRAVFLSQSLGKGRALNPNRDDYVEVEGVWTNFYEWQTVETRIEYKDRPKPVSSDEHHDSSGDWQVFEESIPNMEVRVGAIFALERIAQDSPRDHVQIMEILCAYIRQNSPKASAMSKAQLKEPDWGDDPSAGKATRWRRQLGDIFKTRLDIQTVLNVLGRRSADQRQTEAEAHRGKRGDVFIFDTGFPEFPKTDGMGGLKIAQAARDYRKKALEKRREFLTFQGHRLDLRDCNLQGYDFAGFYMKGADLRGAALQGANLGGAKLQGANLQGATLQGADLGGAKLQGANLGGAKLQGADLKRATLQGGDLLGAKLQEADLWGAKLQGADLKRAELQGANLRVAKLQEANLQGAKLQGADLGGAKLQGANLRDATLQGANLQGAKLQGADLDGAKLQGANLGGAKLLGANLTGTTLQGADLRVAELQGADLLGAALQGADLGGAKLQGANLRVAELQGANLGGAEFDDKTNLNAASLREASLRSVDCTAVPQITEHLHGMFGDGSVVLPGGGGPDSADWPAHWPKHELDYKEFQREWRKWLVNPEGYVPPEPPKGVAG